jgi:hypothetical protein
VAMVPMAPRAGSAAYSTTRLSLRRSLAG